MGMTRSSVSLILIGAVAALAAALSVHSISFASDNSEGAWKDLPVNCYLDKGKDIRYCQAETSGKNKISVLIVPIGKPFELRPVLNATTCPTSESATKEDAIVSVNGGYFNLHGGSSAGSSAGSSTGYITINGQQVCTPKDNDALVKNPKLKPFLEKIFDRSELRFIADAKGKVMVRIQPHSEALPQGFTLQHSLQAGPRLLPTVTSKEEAFLRTEPDGSLTDSIGCLKPAARTAFGITREGKAIIVCVAGPKQDEFSSGMTLQELADYMKKLGCVEAINFDGGTSTTMSIRTDAMSRAVDTDARKTNVGLKDKNYTVVCGRIPETNVKSCLIVRRIP